MFVLSIGESQNTEVICKDKESLHLSVYVFSPHNEQFDVVENIKENSFSSHHFSLYVPYPYLCIRCENIERRVEFGRENIESKKKKTFTDIN